jgi:drug/metabolite transporter (DMT)-like permease
MNADLLLYGFLCECAMVVGQLLLKRAMQPAKSSSKCKLRAALFVISIAAQAVYFFLWIGLLARHPLSSVYPLDAVAAVVLVISAAVFLGERISLRAWTAILLIFAGLLIISFTA